MSIKIKKIGSFGDLIRITNDIINIDVSTAFGPYILNASFCDGENFFFYDEEGKFREEGEKMNPFGEGSVWKNHGGHRLWQSPESMPRTYLPCNERVEFIETEKGGIFRQQFFAFTNTQAEFEIVMSENEPKLEIIHRVTNKNAWPIELAPWAVSVFKAGGFEIVPLPTEKTAPLANGVISLWPYTALNDERLHFGEKFFTLKAKEGKLKEFKLGISNSTGFAAYLINDEMFVKRFEYKKDANYPDNGTNFQTYTYDSFLECESLGSLQKIEYNEIATHTEKWELYKNIKTPDFNDDEEIQKIINMLG